MYPPKDLPSVEYLRECFVLDEQTGALYWKQRPDHHFPTKGGAYSGNGRAGRRADWPHASGYMRVHLRVGDERRVLGAHRIVWKMLHGTDARPLIDHIDRDGTNNRPRNLRQATHSENMQNKESTGRRSKVSVYPTANGKFRAQITVRKKSVHLGTFVSEGDAVAAVMAARNRTESIAA